ncbi:MAG: AAA family ATPase, partial [Eubacterium sp.]|nr:AAA family ATPase [Eubacterium sp.]
MCKVIAICNQKGGVSKTTTTVNLGVGMVRAGKRVLVIDADPQGNLSQSLGIENPDELEIALPNIMEQIIMDEEFDVAEGIIHHTEGIDLMPCNIDLSGVDVSLVNAMSREYVLKTYVDCMREYYDCDGSDLCISHNPDDEATYFKCTPDSKGFNQLHLNALYDLQTRTYIDA